jgi:ABC-type Fe3+/spermidine/putrescine transport system ATPase subunit
MIETRELTKQFASTVALAGVTLNVPLGETVVVLGPSGCGKTTLLRLIAGLEAPDSGEIRINGASVASSGASVDPRARQVGMIFQDLALWPHMRVLENVCFGLGSGWRKRHSAVAPGLTALRRVELERHKDRYPHQLSGGERQRLAIARALAPGYPYLLMDEPFSSLDPLLKDEMISLLRRLRDALKTTIVYVTHDLDEALTLADRILMMKQGRVVGELVSATLAGMSRESLLEWYKGTLRG